ncbi:MAG TPA: ribosome-associated translation inhibitor RaiA [Stellaceae bacterium]|jgi:ribosomal subunit interface protein
MQLTITGKQIESGEALRSHVEDSLHSILEKYFGTAIEAHIVFAKEAHLIRAELSIRIGRGIVVNAGAAALDCYAAFDAAAERTAKRLRRYKRRLRQHHAKLRDTPEIVERARDYVLAPPVEEAEDAEDSERAEVAGAGPAVIAEISTELPHLTVGEAAMRMDLADTPVLLFRNRSHGELNLVYRRADGNVGWIDPEFAPTKEAGKRRL